MSNMSTNIQQLNTLGAFVLGHATMIRRDHLLSKMIKVIPNDLVTELRRSPILSPNLFEEEAMARTVVRVQQIPASRTYQWNALSQDINYSRPEPLKSRAKRQRPRSALGSNKRPKPKDQSQWGKPAPQSNQNLPQGKGKTWFPKKGNQNKKRF